jgi:transcriptional regulator
MSTEGLAGRIELLQGTLDLLILQTLLAGPAHGHAIVKSIERSSEDILLVEQGSLYPALHRLIKRGWITAAEGTSENNRRAKFYRLTAKGRRQLHVETNAMGETGACHCLRTETFAQRERIMKSHRRLLEGLDAEIRDHIERETRVHVERGMPPEEARLAAIRRFGNAARAQEETREVWSRAWLDQAWQDIRFTARALLRFPGFTAIAIATLALGMGMTTAVFSVFNSVLLRPLEYPSPERLVWIGNYIRT